MDVGEDTSLCDSDTTEEFVELLVIADDELKVAWDGVSLLVVASCVVALQIKFESTRCPLPTSETRN